MTKLFIIGFTLALVLITAGSPTDRDKCCLEKTVGEVTYSFVEKEDTAAYNCLSDCVYRKKGEMGPKFCFAKGEQEVQCEDIQSPVDPAEISQKKGKSVNEKIICDDDLDSFFQTAKNLTFTFKRCEEGAQPETCDGKKCRIKWGENIKCMKPVIDLGENCTEDRKIENKSYVLMSMDPTYCQTAANNALSNETKWCPTKWNDGHCACCKHSFYSVCNKQCRCKGICDWFNRFVPSFNTAAIHFCKDCGDDMPTANMPTANMPTANMQTANMPTANMPTANMPTSNIPISISNTIGTAATSPYLESTLSNSYVSKDPVECANCSDSSYVNNYAKECKCECLCKYVKDCTGSDEKHQFGYCWIEYAACCECDAPNNYGAICPNICILTENGKEGFPIKAATATPKCCHTTTPDDC